MEASESAAQANGFSIVVGARRTIRFPQADVYALLSDLRLHWPLLGADLVDAGIVDGSDEGSADLLLRGPFPGLERRVVTRITYAVADSAFGGEAMAGSTRAEIDWRLAPCGERATEVSFDVRIDPGGLRDRLLVTAARPWLHLRCGQVLARLERELAKAAAA
ncbi:MAG: SRPBCC family protein [Solirubrobacterales bacterium]|nr:SRPBCC family protein [Solirubrobacterales bacterium]